MSFSRLSPRFARPLFRLRPGLGLAATAIVAVLAVSPRSPVAAAGQDTATSTVEAGQVAPDFELKDAHGESHRLSELLERGPVVLEFFRSGGW